MKTVKTLGVVLVVFLFLGGYVCAQEQSDAPAKSKTQTQSPVPKHPTTRKPLTVDDMVQKMKKDLNLTDEQADAIKPIIEEKIAKRKELMETQGQEAGSLDAIRSQMEKLNKEQDQQLSKILSPDQMETMKAQRHLAAAGKRQGGGAPGQKSN